MRIRPLFTSTALHAGLVCGMGLWIGTSMGDRRPAPAQIYITPSSNVRTAVVESAVRELEPVELEDSRQPPVLVEPEIRRDPDFEPLESALRESFPELSKSRLRDAPHELLARVIPAPVVVSEIVPQDAVEPASEPAPKSPVTAWVEAVALDDHNLPPAYPQLSVRLRETGIVDVLVTIDAAGSPSDVELVRASRFPRLNRAAIDAVGRWRFTPAERNGVAVQSTQVVGFEFSLSPGKSGVGTTRVR